ncbi:serine/threonine protein kinase [Lentibacter algarum]|uniref:serine/threonine-protein kinase n=1 Tax=Lentibacter algarum TaxID=576131 RepID=UPI001C0774AA|nr:serine/threonine-protein kinase [Lentibacter algarum]MBU2980553.1 serine/threonine protein kinase [Lentibacter algarum]
MKDPMPSDIFQTGQVLNNTYEIKGILGRGGTGEVYLAINQIIGRQSAIKALNAQFSGNSDYLELMKREEQMRNIMHDAVVRYSECSRTDDGHVFLVMDYIEGTPLSDLMFERRVSDQELLIVAHRVLAGLDATHAQGIIHRDLSPDNIILRDGKAERATIIDFGIAKDTATGARTIVGNNFAGKYEYAAPEQLDGHADFRTDLYALGASLLAVARRDVPDVGSNPGEVVRYKKEPLDVSGIKAPLSDLILLLSAPDPAQRPSTALEAQAQLDRWLKPDTHNSKGTGSPKKRSGKSSGNKGLLAVLAAVVIGAGVFFSGALDSLFTPPLPVASPYSLAAGNGPTGSTFSGHAPDTESAALLRAAFVGSTGSQPPEGALTLATGLPDPAWPARVTELMTLLQPLEEWQLDVTDTSVELMALAPDTSTRNAMNSTMRDWAARSEMQLQSSILAGPEMLGTDVLEAALAEHATCGALSLLGAENGAYGMFDPVTITGDMSARSDIETLQQALTPLIGERALRVETTILNSDLCAIRSVMPPTSSGAVSVWLGRAATGDAVMTGIFRTGENPVVDVQLPATITGASLWVMVVDNTGKVFNILPNINQTEHMVDTLGVVENGVRRVRVLWPIAALQEDATRLAIQVDSESYGKSEIVAILSKTPLFGMRRPRDESVSSLAESLAETLVGREAEIIGVASRIIDARP